MDTSSFPKFKHTIKVLGLRVSSGITLTKCRDKYTYNCVFEWRDRLYYLFLFFQPCSWFIPT